ncbi:MAG: DUF5696 domain-containing protein [Clostridia bacterium]|nr:DUF5696 domain-containing protein [Clostridia bacterium]
MKKLWCVLIITVLVAVVCAAASGFAHAERSRLNGTGGSTVLEADGYSVVVDNSNLNFVYTDKSGKVFYSGRRVSEDDGLNNIWGSKVTDAVSVGYRNLKNGSVSERAMTSLDSEIVVEKQTSGFSARVELYDIGIGFTLEVDFGGGCVRVGIKGDSIEEWEDGYRLMYMNVYPFLNASFSDTDGYIFVPDGSGAIIDTGKATDAAARFSQRVYGSDAGVNAYTLNSGMYAAETLSLPIFGIAAEDKAVFTVIDSGAEYASINASVHPITIDYNYVCASFIYREEYTKYYESSVTGKSYVSYNEQRYNYDVGMTMYLLTGEVGTDDMATTYREHLSNRQMLQRKAFDFDLRLRFLMAENKSGLFGNQTVTMTTAAQVEEIVAQIGGATLVSVYGYTKGGVSGSYPSHFPFESNTGGKSGYKSLSTFLSTSSSALSLTTDYALSVDGGNLPKKYRSMSIAEQYIRVLERDTRAQAYLSTFGRVESSFADEREYFDDCGIDAADFDYLGSYLSSEYVNEVYTRTQLKQRQQAFFANTGLTNYVEKPFDYLLAYTDGYYNTPMNNSLYVIETESVPFLQMTLSGYLPMYSAPFNLYSSGRSDVLRLIDYNVYPSFTLTAEDSIELYGTQSSYLFSSKYELLAQTIDEVYAEVGAILNRVKGAYVIDRTEICEGVFVTSYSNGVCIAVNYSNNTVSFDQTSVGAQSAVLL